MKKLILLSVFLLALPASAQDIPHAVGIVVSAQGRTEIVQPSGQRSPALRRAEISEADTLKTGPDGFMQIRFMDGAILSLGCNSSLKINQYKTGAVELVAMHLVRGRIRTVTGTVSPEKYRLQVDTADIRITAPTADFEVVLRSEEGMSSGVYIGSIEVNNDKGSLALGGGGDFDFATAEFDQPPLGVSIIPNGLQSSISCI